MSHGPSDSQARRLADAPVPWDEVRARRVWGRVDAALDRRTRDRRYPLWAAVGTGLAAVAAVLLWWWWPAAPLELPAPPVDRVAVTAPPSIPSIPYVVWPELRLPDDSLAQLRHGARVDVDVHRDDRVHLRQHGGEVRYEVTPDRTREFVVDAAGVEVRVVGTIFTVTLADEAHRVTVSVERGQVEVADGPRVTQLGPGDSLSLDTERDDEVVILEPPPPATAPARPRSPAPSVEALLADADAARARGDLPRAAAALGELVRRYPRDPRAYSALFQLGKVERARGRHAAAASAFTRCWKRSPRGALAEDARAEAAVSWQAAGHHDRARSTARGYLGRYPSGTHHVRMQRLLDGVR